MGATWGYGVMPQSEYSGAPALAVSTNPMASTRKSLQKVLVQHLDHAQSLACSH